MWNLSEKDLCKGFVKTNPSCKDLQICQSAIQIQDHAVTKIRSSLEQRVNLRWGRWDSPPMQNSSQTLHYRNRQSYCMSDAFMPLTKRILRTQGLPHRRFKDPWRGLKARKGQETGQSPGSTTSGRQQRESAGPQLGTGSQQFWDRARGQDHLRGAEHTQSKCGTTPTTKGHT